MNGGGSTTSMHASCAGQREIEGACKRGHQGVSSLQEGSSTVNRHEFSFWNRKLYWKSVQDKFRRLATDRSSFLPNLLNWY